MRNERLRAWIAALAMPQQLAQFFLVGILGGLLDMGITLALTLEFGVYRGIAKAVGAEASILVMFVLNDYWTFSDVGSGGWRAVARRGVTSNIVRMGGLVTATSVFVVVSGFDVAMPVGGKGAWLFVANAIGIHVGFVVNYAAETLVTWRRHDNQDD